KRVRERGTTVVLVTHFIDEAEYLCDRVAVLHGGKLRAVGTPPELVASASSSVRVTFSAPVGFAVDDVLRLPGVHTAVVLDDDGDVEVVGDRTMPVRLGAELVRQDVIPGDFTVVRPSLEDVFVTLT